MTVFDNQVLSVTLISLNGSIHHVVVQVKNSKIFPSFSFKAIANTASFMSKINLNSVYSSYVYYHLSSYCQANLLLGLLQQTPT